MTFRFNIILTDTFTGESCEFMLTEGHMDLIRRALKAYRSAPRFLHERFSFPRTVLRENIGPHHHKVSSSLHQYSGAPGERFGD